MFLALPISFRHVIILERALKGVSAASLTWFARRAQKLAGCPGQVNVLIAGNRRLQELNRVFRGKNRPTDVLSFTAQDENGGDIAISADLARSNAARFRHSASDELRILILHGMLHLAGHDHDTDGGRMAKLEARLRSRLKLPGSLIERAASNSEKAQRSKKRSVTRAQPAPRRRAR
jgi:probable rRNA maturation factor